MTRTNRVLEKLRSGRSALFASPTPYASPKLIEMIGHLDFDGVWIDMEHQDYSYDQVFNMGLACRATDMEAMVRIRKGGYWSFSRALEAGATGVMIPHCLGAEDAREYVKWLKFAPQGLRGMDGVEASARYGLTPMAEYMAWANRETFVAVQIEDREAVEAVDEIAAVEGVDVLFVGPGDLSQSLGVPLQFGHEQITRAIDRVAEAAAKHGKWWGMPVGGAEDAERRYAQGARFFACGAAIILLLQGFSRIRHEFSDLLERQG